MYPSSSSSSSPAPSHHQSSPASQKASLVASRGSSPTSSADLVDEPLFVLSDRDGVDMKLLWFYTTKTYTSFSTKEGKAGSVIEKILKVKVVEHAFHTPFLMDCVLGLAALQMDHFHMDGVSRPRAIAYRASTFEGYRHAIEQAKPESFPALLACSLLLCGLSSQVFRDPDAKPLYIVDWMIVWRGIGLIVDLITPAALVESGMSRLFFRPPVDLDAAALHIPNNLLFMVTSIKESDPEYPHVQDYYDTLKYLGALYQELEMGFSATLDLRIVTFFTFLPKEFIELARRKRPRALVIIAHYLTFARIAANNVWWMQGIGDNDIRHIFNLLGNEWESFLSVPLSAADMDDRCEIGKLLLDNHAWEPSDKVVLGLDRDPSVAVLKLVNNMGHEILIGENMVYRIPKREPPPEVQNNGFSPSSEESSAPEIAQSPYMATLGDMEIPVLPDDD